MANSSHNSSFSLHNATPKQFEEAFEELYMQSPLPKLTKPLFAAREKRMAPPAAQVQNRVKIKAIFDTMKEKNSSMSSELNSSICTSNTSLCNADVERLTAKDCERPRQKENKTPSPQKEQDEADQEAAGISETPRSSRRPPVPESPAMRVAMNFARHAALLDGLSATGSSAGSTDRDTGPAAVTAASLNKAQKRVGDSEPCRPNERECIERSVDVTDPRQLAGSSDTRTDCENAAENVTSEICLPCSQGSVEVMAGQHVQKPACLSTSLSAMRTLESAPGSPTKSSDESRADQETMQLVSKLVQHLQSSSKKRTEDEDEDSDDWDLTSKPVSSRSKGSSAARGVESSKTTGAKKITDDDDSDCDNWVLTSKPVSSRSKSTSAAKESSTTTRCSKRLQKKAHGKTGTEAFSKTVDTVKNCATTDKRKTATSSDTGGNEKPKNGRANKALTRSTGQEQKTTGTRTMRTRNKRPAVTQASSTGEQERNPKAKNKPAVRSRKEKVSDKQDDGEKVEADAITRQVAKRVQSIKDPFSLDFSSDDDDLPVDEDAIACAAKKFHSSKRASRKGAATVNGRRSTSQASRRKERKADVTAATAGKDRNKIHKLSCWSLQPVAHLKSVRIEGKLPNTDYFWLSSVIVERVSSRVLKSTNGSLYQLVGSMAVLHNRAAGFSTEFSQLFQRGFPLGWKELVESSVASAEKNAKSLLSGTLPMPSKKNSKLDGKSTSKRTGQKEKMSPLRKNARVTVDQEKSTTPLRKNAGAAGDPNSFHTPPQQRLGKVMEERATIWTPQGVMSRMLEAKEVRRTQSGRCVIPPLARWAGQYLQRDDDGNMTIGFASLAAEKHFGIMAQHEMLAPVRMRNTPMSNKIRTVRIRNRGKEGPQCQQSRTAGSKAEKSASHSAVEKSTSRKGGGGKRGGRSGVSSDGSVASGSMDVMSLEEEVLSLIQKSKARRLQKVPGKRTTCYSNAAQDSHGNRNIAVSQISDDADSDEDFVSLKNPGKSLVKPVSVYIRRLLEDSRGNLFEDMGPRGSRTRRKQTGQQSYTKSSPSLQQKKDKRRGRSKAEQSDCSEDQEKTQKRTSTRSRTTRGRAAGGRSRQKNPSEPVMIVSDSDDAGDCSEGGDSGQTDATSTAPSSALTTVAVRSRNTRRTRGTAWRNTMDVEIPSPSGKTRRSGRRTRANTGSKKADSSRSTGVDEELPTDDSVSEDGEEKQGRTERRAQSRSRDHRRQTHRGKGTQRDAQLKAGKAGSSRKENLSSSANLEGSRPWSTEEIQNLHRGLGSISSDHPQYWEVVSQYVESRSSKECAAFCLKDDTTRGPSGKAREQKAQQKARHNDKTPVLHGKRGTLKRRRELRAILEHDSNNNNNNNGEDLFQATPYKTGKKAKVKAVDFSKTDEEVFGRNPNFFTPRINESWQCLGQAISHTPASTRKTPIISMSHSPWHTKDSAQKKDVDQYIFRLKKNKRQLTKSFIKKKTQQREGEEKDAKAACPTSARLFNQSPVSEGLFKITEDPASQEEEEEDYYYSEEEN